MSVSRLRQPTVCLDDQTPPRWRFQKFQLEGRAERHGSGAQPATRLRLVLGVRLTDILESLRVIKNFSRVHEELAVDELINCDTYDSGCATGNMFTAFEWIETEGGITTNHHFGSLLGGLSGKPKSWFANTLKTRGDEKDEADAYGVKPEAHFEATPHLQPGVTMNAVQDQMCSAVTREELARVAQVYGYCELSLAGGEKELMHALSKSPVAIGLNANKKFQLYDSGILQMSDCPPARTRRIPCTLRSITPRY